MAYEYSSFNNSTAPVSLSGLPPGDYRVTECLYTGSPLTEQCTVTIHTGGVDYVVSRTWKTTSYTSAYEVITEEQATNWSAVRGDATNLKTITQNLYTGRFAGSPDRVSNPDGTISLYAYVADSVSGQITTVSSSGVPDNTSNPSAATTVTDGTRNESITNAQGQEISRKTYDIKSGLLIDQALAVSVDSLGRVTARTFLDRQTETSTYNCCGLDSKMDRTGLLTVYQYDLERRVIRETVYLGATTTVYSDVGYTYDAAGRMLTTTEYSHGASLDSAVPSSIVRSRNVYNAAGQLLSTTTPRNTTQVATAVVGGKRQVTTTNADLTTRIESYNFAGQLESVSGTAAAPMKYVYGVDSTGEYTQEIKVGLDYSQVPVVATETEWVKTYRDFAGRSGDTVLADGAKVSLQYYAANDLVAGRRGKLKSETRPADSATLGTVGATTLYDYNARGEVEVTALDVDQNGIIDYGGSDRITKTVTGYVSLNNGAGPVIQRTTTSVWATDFSATDTIVSVAEQNVDGTGNSTTAYGVGPTTSYLGYSGGGLTSRTMLRPDGQQTVSNYVGDRLQMTQSGDANYDHALLGQTDYGYDGYGRMQTSTDKRNGVTTFTYFDDGLLKSVTTPSAGVGYAAQTTLYTYDNLGRRVSTTLPDSGVVQTRYTSTGQVWRTWGARTYPQELNYDPQGRLRTLATWTGLVDETGFASTTGKSVTTWNYDPVRGWLLSKRYSDNKGPTYNYYPSGQLRTRTWARGVTTTYSYTANGELSGLTYSDATAPVTGFVYDRLGRRTQLTDAAGVWTMGFQGATALPVSESIASGAGLLAGLGLSRSYNGMLNPENLSVPSADYSRSYFYNYGRMVTVDSTIQGIWTGCSYTYQANSSLLDVVTQRRNTYQFTPLTKTYVYDRLNRLTSLTSTPKLATSIASSYLYNAANQRTRNTEISGQYWDYNYDALGQVTSGVKKDTTATPVPGLSFGYTFDTIGNRTQTVANTQTTGYTPNLLNEYTQRTVPGVIDIVGTATASASVTVNSQPALRNGDAFWSQLTVNNSSGPVWQNLSIIAALPATNAIVKTAGNAYVPPAVESYTYDLDGNLTTDGRWTYTWDAENRLVTMETTVPAATAGLPKQKLEFAYDFMGRRIQKRVSNWSATTYALSYDTRFLYDGWNLVADYNVAGSTFTVAHTYLWGLDLSGSTQGAGGVGGLLSETNGSAVYFITYDGNGNIVGLVDSADGSLAAEFVYDPFGNLVKATGVVTNSPPFGFSTKYFDSESGVLYYGFRYYNPNSGRWLGRDPIEERGGVSLYGMADNDAVNRWDYLGLAGTITFESFGIEYLYTVKDHHLVPRNLWGPFQVGPIAGGVFNDATVDVAKDAHLFDSGHRLYDKAVRAELASFMKEKKICSWLTLPAADQEAFAREFVERIKSSGGYIETYLEAIKDVKTSLALRSAVKAGQYSKPAINYELRTEGSLVRNGRRIPLVKLVLLAAIVTTSLEASQSQHATPGDTAANLVGDVVLPVSPRDVGTAVNYSSGMVKNAIEGTVLQGARAAFDKENADLNEILDCCEKNGK